MIVCEKTANIWMHHQIWKPIYFVRSMPALDFALQISSTNTNNTITNGGSIENRLKLYGTGWTGSYLES